MFPTSVSTSEVLAGTGSDCLLGDDWKESPCYAQLITLPDLNFASTINNNNTISSLEVK